jgi:hypothetical protein
MTTLLVGAVIIGVAVSAFRVGIVAGKRISAAHCSECASWRVVPDEIEEMIAG